MQDHGIFQAFKEECSAACEGWWMVLGAECYPVSNAPSHGAILMYQIGSRRKQVRAGGVEGASCSRQPDIVLLLGSSFQLRLAHKLFEFCTDFASKKAMHYGFHVICFF